jgi:hypothetical protein
MIEIQDASFESILSRRGLFFCIVRMQPFAEGCLQVVWPHHQPWWQQDCRDHRHQHHHQHHHQFITLAILMSFLEFHGLLAGSR